MNIEEKIQEKLQIVFNDDSIIYDKSKFAGGFTNFNYIMDINNKKYVIREPGEMTGEIVDRNTEKENQEIVFDLGLNCEVVYFDELTGIKISAYVENSKNLRQCDPSSPVNLKSVSTLLKKLHTSGKVFTNTFDFKDELKKYEDIVKDFKGDFVENYAILKKKVLDILEGNMKNPISLPCHNDPVPENFIVDGNSGRAYLIDWEYSGMNDPSWDIAGYILESKLSEKSIDYFISDYYSRPATDEEILKIKCSILKQDFLWTLWALIKYYNGEDFLQRCHMRYDRFVKNIKEFELSTDYPIFKMVEE